RRLYLIAVGHYCERWYKVKTWSPLVSKYCANADMKDKHNVHLAESMLRELTEQSETLDKLGVAEELLRLLAKEQNSEIQDLDKLKDQLKKNLQELCFLLRSLLEDSTRTARKSSGKQAIHRLIHEFRAVQRRGSSMVNLQRLIDRIVSELETLGDDG